MKYLKLFLICLLSACLFINGYSQSSKLDSLLNLSKLASHDSTRCQLMIAIGGRYERQSPDSALKWYNKAFVTASNAGNDEQFVLFQASALYQLGWTECVYTGNFDNAQMYTEKSLAIYERLATKSNNKNTVLKAKKGISSCYNNFGIVHQSQGKYDKAYEYYLKSLSIFEELEDKTGISSCCNNIGNILMNQGKYDEAKKYFEKSQKLYEELGQKLGLAKSFINLGVLYSNQGNYAQSVEYYSKAQNLFEELGDKNGISICFFNIGTIYDYQGIYDKAIEFYLKALKISEEMCDKSSIAYCYNNIGLLHSKQRNFDKAIDYFQKLQVLSEELGDINLLAGCFENMGVAYSDLGKIDKAKEFYEKSLKIREQLNDKKGIANTICNIGIIYAKQGDNETNKSARRDSLHKAAIDLFQKSIKIREELDDKNGLAFAYGNTAEIYISLASTSSSGTVKNTYLNKALYYGNKAYTVSVEIGAVPLQNDAAAYLQKAYSGLGKYKDAIKYAEIYISTQDSMFSEEKTKSLAEMQTKYETEKKQQEIEKQQLVIEKQQIDNKRQRNQRNFFIAGSFLLALLALVVFRGYYEKKRSNAIITVKNELLEQANEEIAAQRDLVVEQKEHIEVIHEELTSSIRYARRIQTAVLPSPLQMNELLGSHFVLFKPKDIVSGDFYWTTKVKSHPLPFPKGREENNRSYGYNTADPILYKLIKDRAEELKSKPTIAESILWTYLKTNQTGYHFRRQHIIDRFIVDFVCLKKRLVVEVDGEIHNFQLEEDELRTCILNQKGFKVIRFKNEEVISQPEVVVSKIKEALQKEVLPATNVVLSSGEDLGGVKVLPHGEDLGGVEYIIFCVADCTGHGVPGAFMSMLGVSFLNEIVHKENVTTASEVLNNLRDSIIDALKQTGEGNEQKDGMDIGLCVLNTQSLQMQFAGGYNPCWVVPNSEHSQQRVIEATTNQEITIDNGVIQIKPNKMPIAIHNHMEPFTNHILQLFPGDQIYILSDGYQDQFGGPNKKKFLVKNLRELVVANSKLTMEQQCKQLEKSLEEWMGVNQQIDDITILGVRV